MATTTEIIASQIVLTYEHLAPAPGAFVHLDEIRPRISGTREEQDAALIEMNGWSDVYIEPHSCQLTLTVAQRAAAVEIGNEAKHMIAIGATA